jgi:hypothetical protein
MGWWPTSTRFNGDLDLQAVGSDGQEPDVLTCDRIADAIADFSHTHHLAETTHYV